MLKISIAYPLVPEQIERIRGASPEVDVHIIGEGVLPTGTMDENMAKLSIEDLKSGLADADVIVCGFGAIAKRWPEWSDYAPKARWVHSLFTGADRVPPDMLARGVTFTSSSGVSAVPISETVLTYMLMLAKGWPQQFVAQQSHEWRRAAPARELHGRTVGIVGMGHIGSEIAHRARAFGCRILGMRRSFAARGPDEVADEAVPPSDLHYLLGESDYVVSALPLTAETRGIFGAAEFAAMKPGACFINIARGGVVDEPALIAALQEGRIGGAGLDVFAVEPLPAESPLWDMPNVIITPHSSGGGGGNNSMYRSVDIFMANLRAYLEGGQMTNVVDPARGY
jgi:phosphoglycerate dehydrogenase-like enzyme